jgi:hypothetical protein
MLYDLGAPSGEQSGDFTSARTPIEDRTVFRYKPLFYGFAPSEPLKFKLTFGADMASIDKGVHLDRRDMAAVAAWLTDVSGYKILEVEQPDLECIRYKALIMNLRYTVVGGLPWAFVAEVQCDSPFAYLAPERFDFDVKGTLAVNFEIRADCRFYRPSLKIETTGAGFSIVNRSDGDRKIEFTGLSPPLQITLDNENEILTCDSGLNLYPRFNFNFFRLVRGLNRLEFAGNGAVTLFCEFPVNVGG